MQARRALQIPALLGFHHGRMQARRDEQKCLLPLIAVCRRVVVDMLLAPLIAVCRRAVVHMLFISPIAVCRHNMILSLPYFAVCRRGSYEGRMQARPNGHDISFTTGCGMQACCDADSYHSMQAQILAI